MSVSAALEEAFASGDTDAVVLTTAELNHVSFADPVRIVRGIDVDDPSDPDAVIDLPIVEGGPAVPHKPCAFGFVRPGGDRDGPTDAKAQIDNVSDLLDEHLSAAIGTNAPIIVTIRQYRVTSGGVAALTGPDEEIAGLEMKVVQLTESTADGTLQWPDGRTLNVPTGQNAFFLREDYPALFG